MLSAYYGAGHTIKAIERMLVLLLKKLGRRSQQPSSDANFLDFLLPVIDNNKDAADIYTLRRLKNVFSEPSVINTNVDDADGFAISDLFAPHPTKPGYWKIIGRIDDQIVHNTGKKTNTGPLESMFNRDPHVLAVIMFGRGKYHAPQHSRLFKDMIIVAKPGRPFVYTAKNTVRRQAVLNDYRAEIVTLYETVEDRARSGILPPLEWIDTSTLEFVHNVVLQTLHRLVLDNQDLFQHDCDSLHATRIRNTLLRALRDSVGLDTSQFPDDLVYSKFECHSVGDVPSFDHIVIANSRWCCSFPGGCYAQDGAEVFKRCYQCKTKMYI
ncbi:hypothetical protein IW262DRAFT_1478004 [Armillaria fumosa]|nr:hypothetical protein IW262DRAFT_1478004 [Armillaria fumosa]